MRNTIALVYLSHGTRPPMHSTRRTGILDRL